MQLRRAALNASSAEILPVTSSPTPATFRPAISAPPMDLSTASCRPICSVWVTRRYRPPEGASLDRRGFR
jgi:hypothetical protein